MEKSWRFQVCPCSGCSLCPPLSQEGAKVLWRANLVSHLLLSSPSAPRLLSSSLFSQTLGPHFLVLFQRSSGCQKNCGPSSAPAVHCGTPAQTPGTYSSIPQPLLVFLPALRCCLIPPTGIFELFEYSSKEVRFLRLLLLQNRGHGASNPPYSCPRATGMCRVAMSRGISGWSKGCAMALVILTMLTLTVSTDAMRVLWMGEDKTAARTGGKAAQESTDRLLQEAIRNIDQLTSVARSLSKEWSVQPPQSHHDLHAPCGGGR